MVSRATDDLPEGSVKARFIFTNNLRGCYMMMYDTQSVDLPKDILLEKLHELPPLNELLLVTGVVSCSAYAVCLSDLSKPCLIVDSSQRTDNLLQLLKRKM
jgi:hypothetical protein